MFAFKSFLFETLLLEDKVTFILDKQGEKVFDAYEKDKGQGKPKDLDAKGVIKTLAKWSEKNLQWLVNAYIKGQFSLEDKGRLQNIIQEFDKFKRALDKKDLNQYKDITDIEDALSKFDEEDAKSNKQLARELDAKFFKDKEATIFYEGGGIKIIVPKTKDASCHFGIGTKWCTAATSAHNAFEDYSKRGNLYIVLTNDGRKYQFFFRVGQQQIMDEKDHSINHEMPELIKKYPALITAFEKVAKKTGYLPLIKDPSDEDYGKALKNDIRGTLKNIEERGEQLSDANAAIVMKDHSSNLYTNPKLFSMKFTIDYFKKSNNGYFIQDLIGNWLSNMIGVVTKKEFDEIIKNQIDKSDVRNIIYNIMGQNKVLLKHYSKWIEDLPMEEKETMMRQDKDLIQYFEDDMAEKTKLDWINEDPNLLKSFKNQTPKLKQQAQWAEDRIKRKSRGF